MIFYVSIAALAIITLSIVAAVLFARSIIRPINRISGAITQLASGDATGEIPGADRKDEVGAMALALAAIQDNGLKSKRIETALDCASTSMLITDANHQVVLANDHLLKMLNEHENGIRNDIAGFSTNELVDGSALAVYAKFGASQSTLQSLSSAQTFETILGERSLELVISPIFNASGQRIGLVSNGKTKPTCIRCSRISAALSPRRRTAISISVFLSTASPGL